MTDSEKIRLIGTMIADAIEFTDVKKGEMNTLITCIDAICRFDDGSDE